MKSKIILSTVALVAFIAAIFGLSFQQKAYADENKILYYTCPMHPTVKSDKPGACPVCNMALQPVYGSGAGSMPSTATNNMPAMATKPTPYPLTTCVVSGEKLGEMGAPIVFVYTNNGANQEVKFCCPMCKPKFVKDPDKYMKVIKKAEAKK